jgi:serine protease Do
VSVGERPDDVAENFPSSKEEQHGKLGITVENVTSEAAQELRLSSNKGALVTDVKPGSPADEGGLEPGDVIHEINRTPVNTAVDLQSVARSLKPGSNVLVKVERQGQSVYLAFDLS